MQVGISPKVKIPSIVLLLIGVLLSTLGVVSNEPTLVTGGVSILGASGIAFGTGYKADPGEVINEIGKASDDFLPDEVLEKLGR
jgi:hypothetical protein